MIGVNLIADAIGRRCSTGERDGHEPTRLEVRDLDVAYRVRGVDRQVLRSSRSPSGAARSYGLVGESGCGKSTAALAAVRYLPRNGTVSAAARSASTGRTCSRCPATSCASTRAGRRLDGLPGSRPGAQPVDPRGPPDRRGVRDAAEPSKDDSRERARGDAAQGADRRPGQVMRALSAPALGRHAAAGRDRDGAGLQPGAADPGRADDRPGRDRRGRGARPGRRRCAGVRHARSCSSATTWR